MTEQENDFVKTLEGMLSVAAQNAADNVCTKKITVAVKNEMTSQMPKAIKQGVSDFAGMIGMDVSNIEGVIKWQKNLSFLGSLRAVSIKIGMIILGIFITTMAGILIAHS